MIVDKSYQASADLQAIPNITNTCNKVFLLIVEESTKGKNLSIKAMMAILKVSRSTIVRATAELQRLGLISKSRRHINDFVTYVITESGSYWHPYLVEAYKLCRAIFFSIAMLISPAPSSEHPLSYKDITYTKTTDCSSGNLSLKLYSLYAMSSERGEFLPYHHWPTENREYRDQKRPTTKKESVMEQPKWVTPTLNAATKALNLSKWGQIRLSAYPDQALFHALNVFKSSKSAKQDLFKWFSSVCNEWCKKNNVAPEWGLMHRLAVDNEMPEDPTLILEGKRLEIPVAKQAQRPDGQQELMTLERERMRQKQAEWEATKTPDELNRLKKLVFMDNPGWVELGKKLGVDSRHFDIEEKVVTEIKDQIVCAQIDYDEVVWENLKYSPIEDDGVFEEILD